MAMLRMDNRLHLAPIGENPQRILDIGTGTGIWAIEMGELQLIYHVMREFYRILTYELGDAYPSAQVCEYGLFSF